MHIQGVENYRRVIRVKGKGEKRIGKRSKKKKKWVAHSEILNL